MPGPTAAPLPPSTHILFLRVSLGGAKRSRPRRRGGLSRGAVGRSRTRHLPHNHGTHGSCCSPEDQRVTSAPRTPKKCGAFGRGVAQALGAAIPPAGGADPPWAAVAARGSAAAGADPLQHQRDRWIEHPLRARQSLMACCQSPFVTIYISRAKGGAPDYSTCVVCGSQGAAADRGVWQHLLTYHQ